MTQQNRQIFLASFFISLFVTAYYVQNTLHFGRYIHPVGYDDIGYLADGLERLFSWHAGVSLIKQHMLFPPHSPLYTYLAIAGFSLFGLVDWAPIAMTGIFIFAMSYIFLFETKELPIIYGIIILLSGLTLPFFMFLVTEYRPDMITGLLLAYGAYLFIRRPLVDYPWKHWCGAGFIFGLALLSKPAYGLVSIVLFAIAMGCALLSCGFFNFKQNFFQAIRLFLLATSLLLATAGPHFIFAWKNVYNYIYDNMFGQYKSMWYLHLSLKEQLSYYVFGAGAQTMLGKSIIFIFLSIFFAFICARFVKDIRTVKIAISYGIFIVFSYCIVSSTTYMTPFLGSAFYGSVIVIFLASLYYLLKNTSRNTRFFLAVVICIIIFTLQFQKIMADTYTLYGESLRQHDSIDKITTNLYSYAVNKKVVITSCEDNLAGLTFTYELLKKYGTKISIYDLHRQPSEEKALEIIKKSDVIISVQNQLNTSLPCAVWVPTANKWLQESGQFTLVGSYPYTGPMSILLYVKNGPPDFPVKK